MIHRYIYTTLKSGIELIQNDISLLTDLFADDYELDATEVAKIREYFESKPPTVYNGYARRDFDFPCIAIVMAREAESTTFLADDAGQIVEEGHELYGADVLSSVWSHIYNLLIYADHPDVCAYYYELVKSIMLANIQPLVDYGCFGFKFSGMDLAPDPAYIPEHLFARVMVFELEREFQRIDRDSRFAKAFRVSGIHIDSSGSPSDVGEVETNITPVNE